MSASIGLEEALAIGLAHTRTIGTEYQPLRHALWRVVADNILSPFDIPGFDRSGVDGYAVDQTGLEKLNKGIPLALKIINTIQAGSTTYQQLKAGETCKIMTGAWLPEGTAAVIKQEDIRTEKFSIVINRSLQPGENIQRAGHELKAGSLVAAKGQVLRPEILERIAACGLDKISVYKLPRVSVIDTGTELLLPGSPLRPGQIYGSSRHLLAGKITAAGAIPLLLDAIVRDELTSINRAIEIALQTADMAIISGGTGSGDYDLVAEALERAGARLLFKGIRITPGPGTLAALFQGKLLFNLSGNPHAAGLMFEALIKPVLLKQKGDQLSEEKWFDLLLDRPVKKIKAGRSLHRGEMVIKAGTVYARPLGKASNLSCCRNLPIILDIPGGLGAVGDTVKAKLMTD